MERMKGKGVGVDVQKVWGWRWEEGKGKVRSGQVLQGMVILLQPHHLRPSCESSMFISL